MDNYFDSNGEEDEYNIIYPTAAPSISGFSNSKQSSYKNAKNIIVD